MQHTVPYNQTVCIYSTNQPAKNSKNLIVITGLQMLTLQITVSQDVMYFKHLPYQH